MCNPSWQAGLLMGVSWPQQHGVQSNPHAPQPCRLLLCPLLKHLFSLPSRLPRLFLKLIVSFNWRIITLQYCDGFCHTPTWISHRFTYPPILNPPPVSLPTPSLWVVPEHWLWVPCFMLRACTGHLIYIWSCTCFSAILSKGDTEADFFFKGNLLNISWIVSKLKW